MRCSFWGILVFVGIGNKAGIAFAPTGSTGPASRCSPTIGATSRGKDEEEDGLKFKSELALSASSRALNIWNMDSMNASVIISAGILCSAGVIGLKLDDEEDDVPTIPGWTTIADLDLVESAIPEMGAMS